MRFPWPWEPCNIQTLLQYKTFICPKKGKHCSAIKKIFCSFEHPNQPDKQQKVSVWEIGESFYLIWFHFMTLLAQKIIHYSFKLSWANMRNSHKDQQVKSAAVFIKLLSSSLWEAVRCTPHPNILKHQTLTVQFSPQSFMSCDVSHSSARERYIPKHSNYILQMKDTY